MDKNTKLILIGVGVFVVVASANVAAQALYTHTQIGIDKKALLISAATGIASAFLLMKYAKNE